MRYLIGDGNTKSTLVAVGNGFGVTHPTGSPISGASSGFAHKFYRKLCEVLGTGPDGGVISMDEFRTSCVDFSSQQYHFPMVRVAVWGFEIPSQASLPFPSPSPPPTPPSSLRLTISV